MAERNFTIIPLSNPRELDKTIKYFMVTSLDEIDPKIDQVYEFVHTKSKKVYSDYFVPLTDKNLTVIKRVAQLPRENLKR